MNRIIATYQSMRLADKLFVPVALLLAVLRLSDGVRHGQVWAFAAGIGFAAYAVGKFLQYHDAETRAAGGRAMTLQAAGIGLWLASMIWRFAVD
ncbi:hypothetical protein FNU76_16880 [Chitinimonas arctica]|uniref:MAPEG family protein n=1 Tax=Chitinimonas arctica TaxID=2594795 RepID=A0A516SIB3_9NEIS|nr:hypothetical protein [Chitinimonas arctica]QDQ27885.1 hypothetical protein FNU76_16880 [Chitinimonas arctica]